MINATFKWNRIVPSQHIGLIHKNRGEPHGLNPIKQGLYDFPQSRAFMNSSSVKDNILAASKCICSRNKSPSL